MNKIDPQMGRMIMEKVMEKLKEGDIKAIAVKFGKEDEEMSAGEGEESSGEMCGKCGCPCEDSDNYCRECGEDLNKEEMKEEKVVEKQGDNGGSNEEEMSEEEKNVEKLKEYSKKK